MKLSEDLLDILGHHIDCYQKFTELGKTDKEELKILLSDKLETAKVAQNAEAVKILTLFYTDWNFSTIIYVL